MTPRMHLITPERSSRNLFYNREYACHQSVMAATGGERALWVDLAGSTEPPLLRVLTSSSFSAPSGWKLQAESDYPIETLEKGEKLGFRIKCNPTIRREGKRFVAWTNHEGSRESAVTKWLRARAEPGGFQIIDSTVLDIDRVQIRSSAGGSSGSHQISFATATVTGRVSVTDPDVFRQVLVDGLGPQKAFGCGLMLIKRL